MNVLLYLDILEELAALQGPDDKEACTLSAVLPEHLPTAGDIPQQPLAAVEAAAPGDLLEPPGAAPHDSMPDSSGAAQPALTTQTRQQVQVLGWLWR